MAMSGNTMSPGGNTPFGSFWSGLPGIAQWAFGNSSAPFEKGGQEYQKYFNQGVNYQNPFYQAGSGAIPQYQDWLNKMQNPSEFINNLMGSYQASPYSQYLQQQAMRGAQNMGSATGLTGSSALAQQMQQNAGNIASQDMNQWLQNVLGINTQYGQGLGNELNMGQHAGDVLSNMYGNAGQNMAQAAYGQAAGEQSDQNALWSGIAKMFGA